MPIFKLSYLLHESGTFSTLVNDLSYVFSTLCGLLFLDSLISHLLYLVPMCFVFVFSCISKGWLSFR